MNKPTIQVAAGVIRNEFGQLYLTRRQDGQDFAESLEFPGGKVDGEETPEEALRRELEEEIGIHVLSAFPYEHFSFDYPNKVIEFFFYLVEEWVGEPFGREGQDGFWIAQSELEEGQFPPANAELIRKLKNEALH